MSELLANLTFPAEWFGDEKWCAGFPELVDAFTHAKAPGEKFFLAGGVLTDGTNVIGLCWSTGQHMARCGPPAWAIEERVDPRAPAYTRPLWRNVVASLIAGYRETVAEMRDPRR